MSAHTAVHESTVGHEWRGRAGMIGLIIAESSLFGVFVVAHLFYTGKSVNGPYPNDVLTIPVIGTICLLSSSVSVALGARALGRGKARRSGFWLLVTVLLGWGLMVAALIPGARFWFDLLSRLGTLRSTGPRPSA